MLITACLAGAFSSLAEARIAPPSGGSTIPGTGTLLEETFEGAGPIDGTLTDTGQTWSTSHALAEGGGFLFSSNPDNAFALAGGISLLPNRSYTLSVDLFPSSNGSNLSAFLGLGFATPSFNLNTPTLDGTVGFIYKANNNIGTIRGTGNNIVGSFNPPANTSSTLSIELETGSDLTNTLATWSIDNVDILSRTVDASTINGVVLGDSPNASGTFDNLTLTAIPEPSTTLLGALGLLFLSHRRRA
ncbi:MAG: PEP-CTERM sorting domain-containing protein [Verrucomicrobiota bacterium]